MEAKKSWLLLLCIMIMAMVFLHCGVSVDSIGGENRPEECGDGEDNDGDGLIDCLDFGCDYLTICGGEDEGAVDGDGGHLGEHDGENQVDGEVIDHTKDGGEMVDNPESDTDQMEDDFEYEQNSGGDDRDGGSSSEEIMVDGGSPEDSDQCTDKCKSGESICQGNGYLICQKNNGCYGWSTTVKLCGKSQYCQEGKCVCQNQCESDGNMACKDAYSFYKCIVDGHGCMVYSSSQACSDDDECSNGVCHEDCKNECYRFRSRCNGDGIQNCEKRKSGCWGWSETKLCALGMTCRKTKCSCDDTCLDRNQTECYGDGFRRCETDKHWCRHWGEINPCPEGTECQGGKCR